MNTSTQITTTISETTKEKIKTYIRENKIQETEFIEQAILRHLNALEDEHLEQIVPTRIILEHASFNALLEEIERDATPSDALVGLFRDY
jgi:hypothetical protein